MTIQKDVTVRMPQHLIDRLDAHRGPIPRNSWINLVVDEAIEEGRYSLGRWKLGTASSTEGDR